MSVPSGQSAGSWNALGRELDAWASEERVATLWWRDDDAVGATPALTSILALAREHAVPLGLAVIPAGADPQLGAALDDTEVVVLQHGYAHTNHAPSDEKSCELGEHRPVRIVLEELDAGRRRLEALFAERFVPMLVPPWNRIAAPVAGRLREKAFIALSTFGSRESGAALPGLVQINTHVDLIDWRGTRGFAGEAAVLGVAIDHLRRRRVGVDVEPGEPTGLLTHHLVHDAATWRFIEELLAFTTGHPGARWIGVRDAVPG